MVAILCKNLSTLSPTAVQQRIEKAGSIEAIPDLAKVPPEYHDLSQVFNKTHATSLPPHRPYDCAINLQLGAMPPRGRLFSLSAPEQRAMTEYTTEAQRVGLIRPPSFPAGAGFFFVGKKDGGAETLHRLSRAQ